MKVPPQRGLGRFPLVVTDGLLEEGLSFEVDQPFARDHAGWFAQVGVYLERETFDACLRLPAPQRKLIREVILTFAKVHSSAESPIPPVA